MLEKQVEILTNLVHAQSNIMSKFSCESGANSNPTSECILKIADQAKKISKLEGELKSLQTVSTTQGNSIQQLQATVSGQSILTDPSLRIESSAIINLRGVSTKLNKYLRTIFSWPAKI